MWEKHVAQEEHGETNARSIFAQVLMLQEHQECGKTGNTLTWIRNMFFSQLWNQVQHGELLLRLWLMINVFRIKTHADFHGLLFTALVFLGVYNHTSSSLLCAYRDFHMICIKEIDSWLLWCPRNPWRLWGAFVQECEVPKFSHEPWPEFSLFFAQFVHTGRNLPDLPNSGKQQDFGEAVSLLSFPMVTGGTVPAPLRPPWPTSARALVLLSPAFTGKRDLPEARAFCITARQDVTSLWTWGDLRAQCAFPRGMEEQEMLPVYPVPWHHLPVWAGGKVTNTMLKKKSHFYY